MKSLNIRPWNRSYNSPQKLGGYWDSTRQGQKLMNKILFAAHKGADIEVRAQSPVTGNEVFWEPV